MDTTTELLLSIMKLDTDRCSYYIIINIAIMGNSFLTSVFIYLDSSTHSVKCLPQHIQSIRTEAKSPEFLPQCFGVLRPMYTFYWFL